MNIESCSGFICRKVSHFLSGISSCSFKLRCLLITSVNFFSDEVILSGSLRGKKKMNWKKNNLLSIKKRLFFLFFVSCFSFIFSFFLVTLISNHFGFLVYQNQNLCHLRNLLFLHYPFFFYILFNFKKNFMKLNYYFLFFQKMKTKKKQKQKKKEQNKIKYFYFSFYFSFFNRVFHYFF